VTLEFLQVMHGKRVFRLHRSTTYEDATIPTELRGLSVCHISAPCENGCTDRDAVWVGDSGGPKEPCITWMSRSPMGRDNFEGERGVPL